MNNPKIIALLAFRDEEKYLPGYFRHLERYVDGFIVLDDGSRDSSAKIATESHKVWYCGRNPDIQHEAHSSEVKNRKFLLETAKRFKADWVLCTDADERYEKRFLEMLRTFTMPYVMTMPVRDLWNSPSHYRVDGIWKTKRKPVLFPLAGYAENFLNKSDLHSTWVPDTIMGNYPLLHLGYNLYHLRSIHAEDRAKRVAKFNQIDPEKKFQAIGYDYLNDERGLQLEEIPEGRGYED